MECRQRHNVNHFGKQPKFITFSDKAESMEQTRFQRDSKIDVIPQPHQLPHD